MKNLLRMTVCGAALSALAAFGQPAFAQQDQKHQMSGTEKSGGSAQMQNQKHEGSGARMQERRATDESNSGTTKERRATEENNKPEMNRSEANKPEMDKDRNEASEKTNSDQMNKERRATEENRESGKGKMGQTGEKNDMSKRAGEKNEMSKSRNENNQAQERRNTQTRSGENATERNENRTTAKGGEARTKFQEATRGHELSEKQTTDFRERLERHGHAAETNVSFDARVGVVIPESVTFEPIPNDILVEYPQFRGYDYVMVHDEIVIVDPQSREVVEVVGGPPTSRAAAVNPCSTNQ